MSGHQDVAGPYPAPSGAWRVENSRGTRELESEASLQAEDKGRQKTKAAQWRPRMPGWGAPGQWGSVGRR